ncbi:MAG: NnrU family protein [Candidatus Competibacteraceae bacterium]|nr:NnrU family protein [Candidatus Competibacteraceae bacterium]
MLNAAIVATGFTSAVFLISHLGLSSAAVRGWLVQRIGEKGFQGLYALIALLTLGTMIAAYIQASHFLYLWPPGPGVRHLPLLMMPVALLLVVGGMMIPNPSAVGMENQLDQPEPARGVLRITRHPVMWGVMLWAAVHILANGDLASLLFFGGLLLTALLGSLHLDRRMATEQGERWRRFTAVTSYVPFAAVLSGRQTVRWTELRRPAVWGLGAFIVLLLLHPYLFGVRPY